MSVITLNLSYTPASLNVVGSRGSHWHFRKAKKDLQADLEKLLMVERLPRGCDVIEACADLRFPTSRRRDEGNFRMLLEKCLGDALVNGGWLPDDTPDHFRFTHVQFDPALGNARTLVLLRYA